MARATVPLNFNAFLETAKLKDDGSNYTDWVRNLRIILIVAQELRPGSTARWQTRCRSNTRFYEHLAEQSWWLLDSLVCHALWLRTWTSTMFWTSWSIWDVPGVEVNISSKCPDWDMKSPVSSTAAKWRRIVLSVSIYSKCLGITITWFNWALICGW